MFNRSILKTVKIFEIAPRKHINKLEIGIIERTGFARDRYVTPSTPHSHYYTSLYKFFLRRQLASQPKPRFLSPLY